MSCTINNYNALLCHASLIITMFCCVTHTHTPRVRARTHAHIHTGMSAWVCVCLSVCMHTRVPVCCVCLCCSGYASRPLLEKHICPAKGVTEYEAGRHLAGANQHRSLLEGHLSSRSLAVSRQLISLPGTADPNLPPLVNRLTSYTEFIKLHLIDFSR